MPEICRFYGIVVTMYANDHSPPHFHARYAGASVLITIEGSATYAGAIPSRALGLVEEWAALHKSELQENWDRLQRGERPTRIAPLP